MPERKLVEIPMLDHPRLRETGNGPNVSYEADLLREIYGEADADGVYGAVTEDES